ncbi:MAG: branched-chain amino acid transport system ATP-binding protein, partial [Actinomycetota bacterium]|nr:branched-chain amino acid transport system ATP-binding protein [Actinomycetota bacterium]
MAPSTKRRVGLGLGLAAGASALPLMILVGLNLVEQFDRIAFSALAPEIRDAFGLSDVGIETIRAITGVTTLLAALPLGIAADRMTRTRLCVLAAILWSSASVLTGVVPALGLLYAVRLASGIGQITNEVVHPSLLQDYYQRENHPKVFAVHRVAAAVGAIAGPIAGAIAKWISWQAAFYILAIPTIVFLVAAVLKLREPRRGESLDPDLAAEVEQFGFVPFGEARRQLFSVRTLRRLWLGAFFLGVGALQIDTLLSLFFEKVFHYDAQGRGFVQFVYGAGTVVGLLIGGILANRAAEENKTNRLAVITGISFVQFAIGLVLMAISPVSSVALFFAFFLSFGIGSYQPAYFSLVGLVSPPRVRSQAYAWAILIYGCGGLTYLLLAGIGENGSYRTLTIILAIIVAIAGFIGASAQRFVLRDAEQAAMSLATAKRIREEMEAYERAGAGERPLLVCKGVDVAYDTVQILFGVDMDVKENEIVALLGTNGAGKSTLLKAIAGLVDPIGGAVFFEGRDITHADAVQAARLGIVVVPGGKAVFPTLTVAEHFRAGTWMYTDEDPAEVQRRVDEVLDRFPRLRERWDQLAGNMSGGEQQQLALGMAFVAKPKLLIIDELSLGLAPTIVEMLLEMVRAIHAQGCTIILVEQSVNVALTVADRAYFMEKGEVRFSGPTADLLERGDILRSVFLEGAGATGKGKGRAKAKKGPAAADRTNGDERPVVLDVSGLSKRFGGITAVDDVSLTVHAGTVHGLIGPNGAGKTTFFDCVAGV